MSADPFSAQLDPGALEVVKERTFESGYVVRFEFAPAGWTRPDGMTRLKDHRAYYITRAGNCSACEGTGRSASEKRPGGTVQCKACRGSGKPRRERVESVTSICSTILPKDGLAPWSERAGICGALEAFRRGLIDTDTEPDQAVRIVRGAKLAADAARDEAADRGLNVHALLEQFMLTGRAPNPADHPESHRPFIRGLVRWLVVADPTPVAVELLIANPHDGYAGRLDLLAEIDGQLTLIDLKTQERGSIYEAAHLQTRLYWFAERLYGEHVIQEARVVVVDGRGGFDEVELLADEDLATAALEFYRGLRPLCSATDARNRAVREAVRSL